MCSAGFQPLRLEDVRCRFRKMNDANLLRFGRAAASLCRPGDQFGHPPRQVFVDQLNEARAEWRRRYPKAPSAYPHPSKIEGSGTQEIKYVGLTVVERFIRTGLTGDLHLLNFAKQSLGALPRRTRLPDWF
jgi:hypothetical protein